jgi:hypothetical protein
MEDVKYFQRENWSQAPFVPRNTVGDMAHHVLNRANGREKLFQR